MDPNKIKDKVVHSPQKLVPRAPSSFFVYHHYNLEINEKNCYRNSHLVLVVRSSVLIDSKGATTLSFIAIFSSLEWWDRGTKPQSLLGFIQYLVSKDDAPVSRQWCCSCASKYYMKISSSAAATPPLCLRSTSISV